MCQENIRTPRHYNHYRHNYFLSCLPPLIPNRLHAWLPHPEPGSATAFFLVKGSFALLADLVISIIIVGSLHWADFAVFWHHLVHKIELNKIGWINTFMLFTPNSDSTIWMLERKLKLIRSPNVFLAFYFPFLADRSGTQCGLLLVQPICFNARCVMQSEVLFCIR